MSGFQYGFLVLDDFQYATISGNNNDIEPLGSRIEINTQNNNDTITGILGYPDAILFIDNVSTTNNLIISNNDSNSAVGNRISTSSGLNIILPPNSVIQLRYDTDTSIWREVHNPNLIPLGAIVMWGNVAAPKGWLICDGSAINRAIYSGLFTVLGTTYGTGDGSTTFNLPDLRQRFPLGKAASGTGNTLGATGGNIDHTHGSPLTTGTPSSNVAATILTGGAASTTHTHSVVIPAANPPFQVFNYIIKF